MENVTQLVEQRLVEAVRRNGGSAFRFDDVGGITIAGQCRRSDEFPVAALIPGAARVDLAFVAGTGTGRVVEELVHEARRRRDLADGERRLRHALQSRGERLHVGDFARHQELQGVLGAGVVAEIDQAFVNDLGAGFSRDVAAQIDGEFAGDLEIVGGPGIAMRVEQVDGFRRRRSRSKDRLRPARGRT